MVINKEIIGQIIGLIIFFIFAIGCLLNTFGIMPYPKCNSCDYDDVTDYSYWR